MSFSYNKVLLLWILILYVFSTNASPLPGDIINRKLKPSIYNERESGATYAPIGENREHEDTMQIIRNLHKEGKSGNFNNMQQQMDNNLNVKEINLKDKNRLMDISVGTDSEDKQRVSRKTYHESDEEDPSSRYYQVETPVGSGGSLVLDLHLKMVPPAPVVDCCCENDNGMQNKENCWKVDGRWQCLVTTPVDECID